MERIKRNPLVKLTAWLTAFAMAACLLPVNLWKAEAVVTLKNPTVVTDSNGDVTASTWDCVYFGRYPQSSDGNRGFVTEPIKWRVLSVDEDDAFLLADQNLDCRPYNEEWTDVTWETCTLRSWLNDDFINTAFTASEQNAIRITTVANEDNPEYGTEGGNDMQDKVYLLSIEETINTLYGFDSYESEADEARRAKNTDYAKEQGAWTISSNEYFEYFGNGCWWLRSPGYYFHDAAVVDYDGQAYYSGSYVHDNSCAVRPALHLNLSSDLWSYAGTVSSGGTVDEEGASGEPAITGSTISLHEDAKEAYTNSSCFLFADLTIDENDNMDLDTALKWTSSNEDVLKFAEYQCAKSMDDPNDMLVMARFDTLQAGQADVTVSLGDQSQTCKVTVIDSAGIPNIEASNPYGKYGDYANEPASPESRAREVYYQAQLLESSMNDFYSTVTERFQKDARAANADATKQVVRELRQYDESAVGRGTNPLLTIQANAPDAAVNDAYEVLYDFLKDCVDTGVDANIIDLDIDLSDSLVEIEAGVINKVYDLIRDANYDIAGTGSNGYHVELCSAGGLGKKASFGMVTISKGREFYQGTFVSDSKKVAATMNQFIEDLSNEVRNLYKEAALSLWNDFGENSCISDVTESMLKEYLEGKAEYLIQKGYGKLLKTFNNIKKGENFLKEITSIRTAADAVKKIQSGDMDELLNRISKLDYMDKELVDETVKNALARVESARAALQRALLDYLYNEDTKESLNPIEKMKYFFKATFQCPVDIEVYDESGKLLGSVVDGVVMYGDSIHMELDGDVKTVYIPQNMKASFKLTGRDAGTMNYVLEEYEEGLPSGRMSYYDVPLADGIEYNQTLNGTGLSTDVTSLPLVQTNGGGINADEYISVETKTANVEITAAVEGNGAVAGDGVYAKGDPVTLTAIAADGNRFKGWYDEDGKRIGYQPNCRFTALASETVTARFEKVQTTLGYFVKLAEAYQDKARVVLYEADNETADMVISLYDSETAEDIDVTVEKYDKSNKCISNKKTTAAYDGGYRFTIAGLSLDWHGLKLLDENGAQIATVSSEETWVPPKTSNPPQDNTTSTMPSGIGTPMGSTDTQSGNQDASQDKGATIAKPTAVTKKNVTVKPVGGTSGLTYKADVKKDKTAALKSVKKNKRKSITIASKVKYKDIDYKVNVIKEKAFKDCKKLTKLTLPSTVTKIEKYAFTGAKKLKTIKLTGKKSITVKKYAFKGLNTKKMTIQANKKMPKKEYKKLAKALKKAGFKGKIMKK